VGELERSTWTWASAVSVGLVGLGVGLGFLLSDDWLAWVRAKGDFRVLTSFLGLFDAV